MPISGAAVGSVATTSSPSGAGGGGGGGSGTTSAGGCTSTSSCGAAAGAKQVKTVIRQLPKKAVGNKNVTSLYSQLFLKFHYIYKQQVRLLYI